MKLLKAALLPILLLIVWEVAMQASHYDGDNLAAPSAIAEAFWGAITDGSIAQRTGQTLIAALAGLAVGGGLGLVFSVFLGLIPAFARLMRFSMEVLRPIPPVALIPVALLVYGFGFPMEITLTAFACFWPVAIIGQAAIAGIEPQMLDLGRVLRLSGFARATKIILPATLPRYFVAFRLSAAVALIVSVTVEIAINPQGVGFELMQASQSLHPARMFAMVLWIGIVGWALNWALLYTQRRLFGAIDPATRGLRAGR